MNERFRSFSFVDRIDSVDAGIRIRSSYAIPADVREFPILLVAEAIGQSAAWSAMAALDFKYRPVAGLTQKVDILSSVRPGEVLHLTAEIQSVDAEAVAYSGSARVNGTTIARLEHAVGPMMPQEDFDDPAVVRERFELLCRAGATPGGFRGLPSLELRTTAHEQGQRKTAALHVPESAAFFDDHFPRRPVFPGTMLMGRILDLASYLTEDIPLPAGANIWKLRRTTDCKFRIFTSPGTDLECEAKLEDRTDTTLNLAIQCRDSARLVASARAMFCAEVEETR